MADVTARITAHPVASATRAWVGSHSGDGRRTTVQQHAEAALVAALDADDALRREHTEAFAVLSEDGEVYQTEDGTVETARRELDLLAAAGEPGARVVRIRTCSWASADHVAAEADDARRADLVTELRSINSSLDTHRDEFLTTNIARLAALIARLED